MLHHLRTPLAGALAISAVTLSFGVATQVSAAPVVVGSDLTDGPALNLVSFTDDPAVPFTSPGDGFGIYQPGVSPSIPFSLIDDTANGFPSDTLGIIDSTVTGPFFGATDTVNADTAGPVSATWVFDIAGASGLELAVDVGAMGDFESTDAFTWTAAIDGAAAVPVLSLVVDEDIDQSYTLESGTVIDLPDPLTSSGTVLSNSLTTLTAPIAGSGTQLTVTFTAETDGGSEAVAFRNLVIAADDTVVTGPTPGDLVITEVTQNPAAVADGSGEWFEIQNVSGAAIDIDGWTIADDGSDSHVIDSGGPLLVPAGGFVVLGNNIDPTTNGGVTVDYSYGTSWFLANSADEIILTSTDGVEFDRIEYDGGTVWPDPTGASMSLDPASASAVANDDGANWCDGVTIYGSGDLGTPGAANPECADDPVEPVEPVLISEIQGTGATVAISGPVAVDAIVTSLLERDDALDGFFIQEEDADADADPLTSEGLFVFCRGNCPATLSVGDQVTVTGEATDAFGMSQIDMRSGTAIVNSSGNALPAATPTPLPAPGRTDAEATFENVEGMIVSIPNTMVVSEYFQLGRFGQVVLTDTSRPYQYTHLNTPDPAGYAAFLDDLASRRIILDDNDNDNNDAISDGPDEVYAYPDGGLSTTNRFRGGDTVDGLTGVMHWSFAGSSGTDAWRVRPIDGVVTTFTAANPAPTVPDVGGTLTVASFNVLNYFATIDTGDPICGPNADQGCRGADSVNELEQQRTKIVAAMLEMDADVIGLIELENDIDNASIAELVAGLNDLTSPGTYDYIATGAIGGDAIKVGYIYQPSTVTPAGDFAILDSSVDPTFIDTKSRPVLVQTFDENSSGERFTVAVNHFKSKGSDCDDLGDPDLGDGQANCSQTRAAASTALANFLATDPTGSGDPDMLIIGDLNSYAMEDAITALTSAGYTDLLNEFGGADAYSYVFDGQLGYLDHALADTDLLDQVTGTAAWTINADEIPLFDYNDDVADAGEASFERESSALPLYAPDAARSSDHDPVLVGLALNSAPPVPMCAGQAATIIGTPDDNLIFGTSGADVIVTFGGDDLIFSGSGNDTICSGDGHDLVFSGNGRDTIESGAGNDVVFSGSGKDVVTAGDGNDFVIAGNGADKVDGGAGNDRIYGNSGKDVLDGGDGIDRLSGGSGRDTCTNAETAISCEY